MNLELERRFLINTELGHSYKMALSIIKNLSTAVLQYRQGYLHEQKPTTRIRIEDGGKTAAICIKGKKSKSGAPEFEYEIPYGDGNQLFEMCGDRMLTKIRHLIPHGCNQKFMLEVDVFKSAPFRGLIIAEVEKPEGMTEAEFKAYDFVKDLPWTTTEITGIKGWSNFALARNHKRPKLK